jgi:NAD dependent epimerase/dehydratase
MSAIQTVLVTGAGGFIGSHLVETLLARGLRVRALVRYNGKSHYGHLEKLAAAKPVNLEIILGDVTDGYFVHNACRGVDAVCHLAALIGIPYSYVAPASYVDANLRGTLHVLEAARSLSLKRVIVTSTSEVYGTAQYAPIDEKHPLQGQSPYSASKIAADKMAEAYFRSFEVPVVTLRPFNTYGPRQSARAVIPTIISQALSGAECIKLGSLDPQRDLTFVTDTAEAFALALEKPGLEGETIHFGQGEAISVGDLAQLCLKVAGSSARIEQDALRVRPEKSEVGLLLCNADKARALLGWSPKVKLEQGLAQVTDYVRENLAACKPGTYLA